MRKRYLTLFAAVVCSLIYLSSCRDDTKFFTDSSARLETNLDTVFFDTVFTSTTPRLPLSVNKQFVVVNPYKDAVKTNIRLVGGESSPFRINADGYVGPDAYDLEILGEDSVFVFVELHVDPNNDPQSMPLIVRDSIEITTNGSSQYVQLVAWGQDAHYFLADTLCDAVLDDKLKPYVVHTYLYVPENCTLTIKEGVKMHFAPKSWLYVEGTLKIEGTKENPVKIEGDRLEPDYEEVPGQWGGIWIDRLSKSCRIKHAEIKNGTVGIYCDSTLQVASQNDPDLLVENTMVRNMTYDGLSGKFAHIVARNSVFANCGRYSFLGLWGGLYDLKHCNFVTYGYDFARKDPTFVLNNIKVNEFYQVEAVYPIDYDVRNCIIFGPLDDEISFALLGKDDGLVGATWLDSTFDNNLVKTEQKLNIAGRTNVLDRDTVYFTNFRKHDYHLDKEMSPAIDIGDPSLGITIDFEENPRNDGKPDAGAFEVQK